MQGQHISHDFYGLQESLRIHRAPAADGFDFSQRLPRTVLRRTVVIFHGIDPKPVNPSISTASPSALRDGAENTDLFRFPADQAAGVLLWPLCPFWPPKPLLKK
ncbi:hypothetical protein SDC9_74763 [bioreactor metagenome]|uniref:Uncharacterized protein n=1 Tax=bioreactor metagenome TaxID=1076179 RepID=A0A644YP19_9ZZZZ